MNSGEDPDFDTSLPPWRDMYAVILAKLTNSPNFERLVDIYQPLYDETTDDPGIQEKWRRLVEYLRALDTSQ